MIPSSPDFPFDYRAGCVIRKKGLFHETRLPVSRRTVLVALIFLLALSLLPLPATAAANWYNISWPYRQNITINKAYVNGTGVTLTNFPVLVSITDTYLTSSQVQSNGNDILFTASDGVTKLPHEIENFTQGTGTLVAWVNVPSVTNSTNTTIYMYYGNLTVTQPAKCDRGLGFQLQCRMALCAESRRNRPPGTGQYLQCQLCNKRGWKYDGLATGPGEYCWRPDL